MSTSRANILLLLTFLVVVVGVGFAIGLTIRPGAWYASLDKPFFTPPNWVFGPAWTVIYVLIAIAGWRVASIEGLRAPAFRLWILQLVLNWAWTPVFFGLHQTEAGLAVLLGLIAVVVAFIRVTADRLAAWCFVPYVCWLSYAAALNMAIVILN